MKHILIVVAALLLAGCGVDAKNKTTNEQGVTEFDVTLTDGRTIRCVEWDHGGHGIAGDCDWAGATDADS